MLEAAAATTVGGLLALVLVVFVGPWMRERRLRLIERITSDLLSDVDIAIDEFKYQRLRGYSYIAPGIEHPPPVADPRSLSILQHELAAVYASAGATPVATPAANVAADGIPHGTPSPPEPAQAAPRRTAPPRRGPRRRIRRGRRTHAAALTPAARRAMRRR